MELLPNQLLELVIHNGAIGFVHLGAPPPHPRACGRPRAERRFVLYWRGKMAWKSLWRGKKMAWKSLWRGTKRRGSRYGVEVNGVEKDAWN